MSDEKEARKNMFGYVQVFNANSSSFELPDPYLLRLLMNKRKSDKASQLLEEKKREIARIVNQIKASYESKTIDDQLITNVVNYGVQLIKPEFRDQVMTNSDVLKRAARLGFLCGTLDPNRKSESPPVALRLHRDALRELVEGLFSIEDREDSPTYAACVHVSDASFYGSRMAPLPIAYG
jgi:hypothetical protein